MQPIVAITQPPQWKNGMGLQWRPPRWKRACSANSIALSVRPPWRSSAPFGKPVVPDVNGIW